MARGYLKEIEYRKTDICCFIRRLMSVNKVGQRKLAEIIGCGQPRVCQKLKSGAFTLEELLKIFKALKADCDMVGHLMCLSEEERCEQ